MEKLSEDEALDMAAQVISGRFCLNQEVVRGWLLEKHFSYTEAVDHISKDFEGFLSEVINLKDNKEKEVI